MTDRLRAWERAGGDDRMAELTSRAGDDDPAERRYAGRMLDLLWRLRDVARRSDAEGPRAL